MNPPHLPNDLARGSVPGAASTDQKRLETLGTFCLVFGITELLYAVYQVLAAAMGSSLLELQRRVIAGIAAGMSGRGAPAMPAVLDAAQDLVRRIAIANAVRMVPFVIASGVLVALALRLRRGDLSALRAARTWSYWALGVVGLSALLQLLVTVPATMDYGRRIFATLPMPPPGRAGPPFDVLRFMDTVMMASAIGTALIGSLVLAIWPICAARLGGEDRAGERGGGGLRPGRGRVRPRLEPCPPHPRCGPSRRPRSLAAPAPVAHPPGAPASPYPAVLSCPPRRSFTGPGGSLDRPAQVLRRPGAGASTHPRGARQTRPRSSPDRRRSRGRPALAAHSTGDGHATGQSWQLTRPAVASRPAGARRASDRPSSLAGAALRARRPGARSAGRPTWSSSPACACAPPP
jgi:hypothetical protein